MKKAPTFVVASVIALSGASCLPSNAACLNARLISSYNDRGRANLVTGSPRSAGYPGGNGLTYLARGAFWSLGNGDPDLGKGNDSGENSGEQAVYLTPRGSYNWLKIGSHAHGGANGFFGGFHHWQYRGTDGCIDLDGTDPSLPDDRQCNVVLVDDDDWEGRGYFVLIAQDTDAAGDYFLNLVTGNRDVPLAPIPPPRIKSARAGNDGARALVVEVPCPAGTSDGIYVDCDPDQNETLISTIRYRLYAAKGTSPPAGERSRDLPGGFMAPSETDKDNPSGWFPIGEPTACGKTAKVVVPCTGKESMYLCAALVFDPDSGSGFSTTNCSANALRVACAATTAPDPPRSR
jgi:hypothetical protein